MAEDNEARTSSSSSDHSSEASVAQLSQDPAPAIAGLKATNGNIPNFPLIYPALVPPQNDQEMMNHGPGLYAFPVLSSMQHIPGFPPYILIPFTYNVPIERSTPENREAGSDGQGQQGDNPQQQQQVGPQRQVVVRRFQIAIHIDLLLILKLAAVIFLFNQDGSKQRLTLLVFFASIVYLYQTGALAPIIRWLSLGMRRAAQPPQPPQPPPRADNVAAPDGQRVEENENPERNEGNPPANENEHPLEGEAAGNNRWWGIVKEIQMIVFGFITSLLPGFHNID